MLARIALPQSFTYLLQVSSQQDKYVDEMASKNAEIRSHYVRFKPQQREKGYHLYHDLACYTSEHVKLYKRRTWLALQLLWIFSSHK